MQLKHTSGLIFFAVSYSKFLLKLAVGHSQILGLDE